MADADAAMTAASAAEAEAMAAQAEVDAMMADAYQPSAVMVSAEMLDPSMANLDHVQVSLAGPDSIYVSNIMYGGQPYSALLKYTGGTSATVEAVYGPMGKLLPDSVGLSQTGLAFVAPASLAVSNVEVGGVGYSGTLEYAGGNQLRVTGIRQVTLPPTAAEAAAAAVAQAEADAAAAVSGAQAAADAAMADKTAAMADAEAAQAAADAAMADADAAMTAASAAEAEAMADAQAEVDAMMADAYQPSAVMVSAEMLDPSMANLDHVQVSLAGPDSIYVSNIMYAGQPYSALLKYTGGTSATVEAVYGPMGKLLPDSVGLSQTGLAFVAPASLAVSNVEVGGVGYSGTLEYAGGNQLRVTGIRQVTLPPTAAEVAAAAVAQAEADAAAAVSAADAVASEAQAAAGAAQADAAMAVSEAQAAADAAVSAAMADADTAMAAASAAEAEAADAQAQVDAMMADAYQPSAVMVSAEMLDPSMANLDQVQVSLAGPDSIYVSNIMYGGQPYSALLKYTGGTSATVEAVYGPMGKLLPDSVGLSQTGLAFVAPASLAVSNVEVGGVGYSGTLEYAGGNQLRVTGIRQVTLPPTAAEAAAAAVAQAEADAAAAVSAADALASEAQAAAGAAMADKTAAMAISRCRSRASGGGCGDGRRGRGDGRGERRRSRGHGGTGRGRCDDGGRLPAFRGDGLRRDARSEHGQPGPRAGLPGRSGLHLRFQHHVRRSALLRSAQVHRRHQRHGGGGLRTDGQAAPRLRGTVADRAGLRGAGFPRRLQRRGGRGRLLRHPGVRRRQPVAGHRYPPSHPAADGGGSGSGGGRTGRGRCSRSSERCRRTRQ